MNPVIPAWMPESSVQGWQTSRYGEPYHYLEASRPSVWMYLGGEDVKTGYT